MLGQFRSDGYLIVRFDRLRMSGGSEEGFVTDLKMYEIYDHAWGLDHFKDSEGKTLQDVILNTPIGPLDIKWCNWCHIAHTEIYCFEIYTEEEYRRLKRLKRLVSEPARCPSRLRDYFAAARFASAVNKNRHNNMARVVPALVGAGLDPHLIDVIYQKVKLRVQADTGK